MRPRICCNGRIRPWALVAVVALSLSVGCTGHFERPRTPAVIGRITQNTKVKANSVGPGYGMDSYQKDFDAYNLAADNGDPKAVILRNKLVYSVMAEIDNAFGDYESRLYLNQGSFLIGSDVLQLGLAAASTVTNGARGKTLLSALLSGIAGSSLSVDKNFYRQQTLQAIISMMDANRDRIKTVILQQLRQDVATYPFQAARSDLIRYFFAGTLVNGLQEVQEGSAVEAKAQQGSLSLVQVQNITPANVQDAINLNKAVAAAFQSGDFTKLVTWLNALGQAANGLPKERLETIIRELGRKIPTDEALRTKYFDEARKAGLIQ